MERRRVAAAVARVRQMEAVFDALQNAAARPGAAQGPVFRALLVQLIRYYEGGRWMEDYQLDEQGLLPPGLKRGVLSEDGVYNFLSELERE